MEDPAASVFTTEVCSETWLCWEVDLRRGTSNKEPIPSQWEKMGQRKRRLQGPHWFIIKTGSGIVKMYRLSRDPLSFLEEK
jgi:hypothetical protein